MITYTTRPRSIIIFFLAFFVWSLFPLSLQASTDTDRKLQNIKLDENIVCSEGPKNPRHSKTYDLDSEANDWGVYCEGFPLWIKENVATPSADGKALRCGITGGFSHSNIHCYTNLNAEPDSKAFTLSMNFKFTPTTCNNQPTFSIAQALEFTMSKWYFGTDGKRRRVEFALQWMNVPENASLTAPQWRYWKGVDKWVVLPNPVEECLEGRLSPQEDQWNTLTLYGEIVNNKLHYSKFIINGQTHIINVTFEPVIEDGALELLAAGVQLDGNSRESPYDLIVDKFHFIRSTILPIAGKDFGIREETPHLTWNEGTAQSSFWLYRFGIFGGSFEKLPAGINPLPFESTSYTDTSSLNPHEIYCYVLTPQDVDQAILGISDATCIFTNTQSGIIKPENLILRLNQSSTAFLTWQAPSGGVDGYLLYALPLDGSSIRTKTLSADATNVTDDTKGGNGNTTPKATCYWLVAIKGDNYGYSDGLCGIPGVSTLSQNTTTDLDSLRENLKNLKKFEAF